MSGSEEVVLWFPSYKLAALSSALEEQGSTVEKRMQAMLDNLYMNLVPKEIQQEIQTRIDAEYAAEQAAIEAAKRYTAFRIRQSGTDVYFQSERRDPLLSAAKLVRSCLQLKSPPVAPALRFPSPGLKEISESQYDQMMALRMENPEKIIGVFDLNFDKQEISVVDAVEGWKTYSMKDVSSAVYRAYRKGYLTPGQYEVRFLERLAGREIASANHLSAREISLADEISEMDGYRLNFYLDVGFNVDAVFGTHVCTEENDDTLNVYADYDMAAGQVCDMLEIELHWADGRDESMEYWLNAAEKAVLLRKMDAYCQQQTGQTLAEYSAQRLAEDMEPYVQPICESGIELSDQPTM